MITIGVMSGTSLDGADAVIASFPEDEKAPMATLGRAYLPMPGELREELKALALGTTNEIERAGDASVALADLYAAVIEKALQEAGIGREVVAAVGLHGQTIRHRPERGFTLQLNHPARVAELTGIDVVADFRSRDVAAGGEGAPLVPAFHAGIFQGKSPAAALNIGGIANLTLIPPEGSHAPVLGFDTGPGNMLLDAWMEKSTGRAYDADGAFAASGAVIPELLSKFLCDPFFARPAPKSTGRERFSLAWLEERLALLPQGEAAPQDVAATLTELTAETIADALAKTEPEARKLYVCGGGALNLFLMKRLGQALLKRMPGCALLSSEDRGLDPMEVEGAAFAWLARAFLLRRPGNLPAVTRAKGPRILGALYPA